MVVGAQIAEHRVRRPLALLRPYVDFYVGYHYAGFEPGQHMGLPSRHLTFVISFDDPLELAVLPDGTPPPDEVRRPRQRAPHDAGGDPPRRHRSTASSCT